MFLCLGTLIECLLTDCDKVLTLLCSEVLQTEIRVLYKLLYIVNNSFRQHKPFRAIKQVEQCINRLKEMKLQAAIEDLKELCPNKLQRDAGAMVGECDVPSQPMLEWLCLKLLGASSLLARTQERCTQAFMVFFRGILRVLIPMYKRTTELLQKVSQFHPMAYLTNFTLPGDLKDFLCLLHPDLLLEESTKETVRVKKGTQKSGFSLLSRLFKDKGLKEDNGEEERVPILAAVHDEGSSLDLGAAVLQRWPVVSSCGLDMKVVLQQSCKTTKQMALEPQVKSDISSQAAVLQKRNFLKSLRKVSSFRNVAAHLKEMMHWCRSCKFHQKRKQLAFLHLMCLRMECLEAEGVRVEKRLKAFKLKVQKALMLQKTLMPQKHSSFSTARWRTRWHHGSFMARYRLTRRRSAFSRICSRPVKDLLVSLKNKRTCRPQQQSPKEEVSGNNKVPGSEEKMDLQTALQKPNQPNDDIDDIFASFGF
ncbi:Nucleolus and neural progenitor protein [Labeo rohita]|uniref:Nucleolus and neural progenitor protein n=1 Tax=Labeo rohita TaxID=84645 RepID=A0ABQ8MCT7_LABRO|nr:Nucleolus and neural progenitor protein [Labeo rohita]